MDILLRQALPYKDLNYFRVYFTTMQRITSKRSFASIRAILPLLVAVIYELLHYAYLGLFSESSSVEAHWRHYDTFRLLGLTKDAQGLNLGFFCLLPMTLYFLYLLYLSRHSKATFLLYHILVLGQSNWFLEPTTTTTFFGQKLRISMVDYSRRLFLGVVNVLQVFAVVIDLFILASQAHALLHYFVYQQQSSFLLLVDFVATQASLLLRYAFLHTYAHVCILMATLGIVIGQLFILKLGQLRRMLFPRSTKQALFGRFSLYRYSSFLRENTACLTFITSVNRLFSRALTAYILVNCPLNAMLMTVLLMTPTTRHSQASLSVEIQFFTVVSMLQQWLCTFAVHLQEAALNERLHRPSRRALHLVATLGGDRWAEKHGRLAVKLKVAQYIAAFHVPSTARYGITYWNGSLITMMSFAEFVLLYSQITMYSFKWFHEDRLL